MNIPTRPADSVYSVDFWTTLQKEYSTGESYLFCSASPIFETYWFDNSFRHACRLLANKFAESLGHQCDYQSGAYLFSCVVCPSLFEYYDAKTPLCHGVYRDEQLRRVVRLDFLDWVIAGLTDGTIARGQNDL